MGYVFNTMLHTAGGALHAKKDQIIKILSFWRDAKMFIGLLL